MRPKVASHWQFRVHHWQSLAIIGHRSVVASTRRIGRHFWWRPRRPLPDQHRFSFSFLIEAIVVLFTCCSDGWRVHEKNNSFLERLFFIWGGELISPPPRSTNFLVDSRWRAPFGLRAIQWRVSFLWQFFFSQISSALVVFYIVMVDGPHVIST